MMSGLPSDYRVRLGMFQLSAGDFEQELAVKDIFNHPKWDLYTPGIPYDMALLKVDGTIDLKNPYISAIPMGTPSETYAGNPDCWISGWGRSDRSTNVPSDYLLEAHVP